jgi:hypothetical protein
MPSKADLSLNWREPLPAAAAKKLAALAAKPVTLEEMEPLNVK